MAAGNAAGQMVGNPLSELQVGSASHAVHCPVAGVAASNNPMQKRVVSDGRKANMDTNVLPFFKIHLL